jgi:4-amino-4-deoxy-L-arabinose transferase-like glycosyltransferase
MAIGPQTVVIQSGHDKREEDPPGDGHQVQILPDFGLRQPMRRGALLWSGRDGDDVNPEKLFWPLVLVLLAAMGAAQVTSALQESQTWDEAIYIAAGYSYLRTGDYRMNLEHPPLGKILVALPLMLLHPDLDTNGDTWRMNGQATFGSEFLYRNRLPAETILLVARLVVVLLTLCLGLAIALWTRRLFGATPALVAVFLFALDPNFIAHGHYATNDVLLSLTLWLAMIAWSGYLKTWRFSRLFWAWVAVAAAILSKFSGLFLVPVLLLLFGIRWWQQRGPVLRWMRRLALSMAMILVTTVILIGASYWKETWALTFDKTASVPLTSKIDGGGAPIRLLRSAGHLLSLPAYSYLVGLGMQMRHAADGHDSYVLGRRDPRGVWYYFPVAFAVKTPTTVLILMLIALAGAMAALSRLSPRHWLDRLREARFEWFVLVLPPGLYFLLATFTHINIGLRHILPVYPFLFVLIAASVLRTRGGLPATALSAVLCLAGAMQAAETIRIHPHYTAFFNTVSGGPDQGPRYLVDSNLDWGQDLGNLKRWLERHGKPRLCFFYFGSAIPEYYGIQAEAIPPTWDSNGRANVDCIAAVSATVLRDVYVEAGRYKWLRELRPLDKVGYSIYIYDLRKNRTPLYSQPAPPRRGTNRQ